MSYSYSLMSFFIAVFYIACTIAAYMHPNRLAVSVVAGFTFLLLAWGFAESVYSRFDRRVYWKGFVAIGFGYLVLNPSYPPREFFSLPVTLIDTQLRSRTGYAEWHPYDQIPDEGVAEIAGKPGYTLNRTRQQALQSRFRVISHFF